ncbi:GSCOCG00003038001-RA-CDS, partial [Cotesia congregata]
DGVLLAHFNIWRRPLRLWVAGACTRGRGRGRTQARARKRRRTSLRSRSLKEGVRGAIDSSFNLVVSIKTRFIKGSEYVSIKCGKRNKRNAIKLHRVFSVIRGLFRAISSQ